MNILIVGGGKVSEELLSILDLKKNSVIVVERDQSRRQDILSRFDVIAIGRDATDLSIYTREIDMESLDAVVALTDDDETNILVTALANLRKIPYRICRLKEPEKADLVRELNLGIPISLYSMLANMINLFLRSMKDPFKLGTVNIGNDEFQVYVYTVPENSTLRDKSFGEIRRRFPDIVFLLVFDGKQFIVPNENYVVKLGDQLVFLTKVDEALDKLK